jgi:hypothetical protein
MSFYKEREDFVRSFAEQHYQVLHDQGVEGSDTRRSFFRINDEEELTAASQHWIHFPCVVMDSISGGLIEKDKSVRQQNVCSILFLQKLMLQENNPITATAITDAYDITFDVMKDYIAFMYGDILEDDGCGVFKGIDMGRIRWVQAGPIGDQLYGWQLTIPDEVKAGWLTGIDEDHFVRTGETFDFTYIADGTESSSIEIPELEGKYLLLLARENALYNKVLSSPGLRDVLWIGTSLTFMVELGRNEIIKGLYK